MVKKTAVILGILATLTIGAGMSWGYTVSQWPAPGIPGEVFPKGTPCLLSPDTYYLKGPVAPSCRPPLIPGAIHAAVSIPFRAAAMVVTPLFAGGGHVRAKECCNIKLGEPAYVTAAVPCTSVNSYLPPRKW